MNPYHLPHHLRALAQLMEALVDAAGEAAAVAQSKRMLTLRSKKGVTLKPGPDTPLWTELVRAVREELTRRGDKSELARFLGISRQRLHLLIVARTACADAERTLLLLSWLAARRMDSEAPPEETGAPPLQPDPPKKKPGPSKR